MVTRPITLAPRWPAAMLVLTLALQATLVTGRAINWDEFFHYSQIHKLVAGTLSTPLQTLYTRAFAWVVALPGSGIDHIITIRWFMLGCELAILAAIVGIASRFASRQAAWLAALAYASGGYVFQHATSFRFDSPAAALLMTAAWILLRSRLGTLAIIAIGLLIGSATVLTIKAALFAPVFAGIAWLRWSEAGRTSAAALRIVACGATSLAAFAVIYGLHASTLTGDVGGEALTVVGGVGTSMFSIGLQPYWLHHLKGFAIAPAIVLMLIAFPFILRRSALSRPERVALIGLILPLSTLLFYHNSAPYYFVFMLAPICAALALVLDRALPRYGEARIALLLGGLALAIWAVDRTGPLDKQREILAAADMIFPDKPAYFDSSAMLGHFPKANAFMTPAGTAQYLKGAYPPMTDVMARQAVPLVLASDELFERVLTTAEPVAALLPQDLAALRETYVPFWGPFWIAGRAFPKATEFTLRVPGQYRVEGSALRIDGRDLQPDALVTLGYGPHRAEPLTSAQSRIVWAAARRPAGPPPAPPYFGTF